MQIKIDFRFTSLNDYISAERTNRFIAARIKRDETEVARLAAVHAGRFHAYPADILFQWYCSNTRTDPDNIEFAKKFILDGLVLAGVLDGDKWKHICHTESEFHLASEDYVVVNLRSGSRYQVNGE